MWTHLLCFIPDISLTDLLTTVYSSRMGRKQKLSEEDQRDICAAYVSGETSPALAEEYETSTDTILAALRRGGVRIEARGRPPLLDDAGHEEAFNLRASGKSVTDIAADLEVSCFVIRSALARYERAKKDEDSTE